MAHTITFLAFAALAALACWFFSRFARTRDDVRISVRLDRPAPGAHLIWDVTNGGADPITLTRLVVYSPGGSAETAPATLPMALAPQSRLLMPVDVDWSMLSASAIAVVDERGDEHPVPQAQLRQIQQQLHTIIDRPGHVATARDWLFGAADLVFGATLLGLAVFLLMYVIATG